MYIHFFIEFTAILPFMLAFITQLSYDILKYTEAGKGTKFISLNAKRMIMYVNFIRNLPVIY